MEWKKKKFVWPDLRPNQAPVKSDIPDIAIFNFQSKTLNPKKDFTYFQNIIKRSNHSIHYFWKIILPICCNIFVNTSLGFIKKFFFSKFQVGLSRSTTGCVAACIFREFQLSASYEGLIETVPGINLEVLRMDKYVHEKEKDALFRGEFEVVKELMAELEDGAVSNK